MNRVKIPRRLLLIMTLVATQAMTGAGAVQTRLSGHVESQVRWFRSSPPGVEQQEGLSHSFAVQPEWRYQTGDRRHDFAIVPFARFDADDDDRTHVDIRQLYWLYHGEGWEALVGIDKVFWGVAESRHLVDIVNQTDLVEDPDEENKLGQPMLRLTLDLRPTLKLKSEEKRKRNWGKLSLFLLPGFRERTFPGHEGRLRAPIPVDEDEAVFTDGASKDRVDLALRYSHTIGRWDMGLHYFHGNAREPHLSLNPMTTRMVPYYTRINQMGLDLQYTGDVWLGKFEGIIREGQGRTFGALVAGAEYTKYGIFGSNADVGLLAEYLYDDRDSDPVLIKPDRSYIPSPVTPFDNDLFLGTRLSLNDAKSTQVLAGVITSLDNDEYSFNVEATRRFTKNINAELLIRAFGGDEPQAIKNDDYVQFSLFYNL